MLIFFSWPILVLAEPSALVISEIMYDVSGADSGREWIELYNTGPDNLLVTSTWRFFDSSNHKINLYQGTSTITSQEFFILADNAEQFLLDYPDFSGNLFDTVMSLPNSSSSLALSFDNGDSYGIGEFYDSVWGGSGDGYSLEKKDFYASSTDNWQISSRLGGTPGQINSLPTIIEESEEEKEITTIDEVTVAWEQLLINEILPNPAGSDDAEWIELYNQGPEVLHLSGLQISDASSRVFVLDTDSGLALHLLANQYLLIPKDISGISLNNFSDELSIIDPDDKVIDFIAYDKAPEAKSYARSAESFVWTNYPTPGLVNQIVLNQPPVSQISATGDFLVGEKIYFSAEHSYDPEEGDLDYDWDFGDGQNSSRQTVKHSFESPGSYTVALTVMDGEGSSNTAYFVIDIYPPEANLENDMINNDAEEVELENFKLDLAEGDLIISEFMPNPVGSDDGEWIELYNSSNRDIDLYGWYLDDADGGSKMRQVATSTIIEAHGYLVFPRADTKLTLNNTSDSVRLFTPLEEIWQEILYEKISEGKSYAWDNINNEWVENQPSPGQENIFYVETSEEIIYNVSDIADLEKGEDLLVQGVVLNSPDTDDRSLYLAGYNFSQTNLEELVEIYSYYKNFPKLQVGQLVTIKGQLSGVGYLPRIKIRNKEDIILNDVIIDLINPEEIFVEDVGDYLLGSYTMVRGTVVKKSGPNIYLSANNEEDYLLRAYSKFSTKELDINKGDQISVQGILLESNDSFKLILFDADDIVVWGKVLGEKIETSKVSSKIVSSTNLIVTTNHKSKIKNILIYIAIFLFVLIIVYYSKKRFALRS